MASSGAFTGNALTVGGRGGNYYYTNWQVAGQDIGGNYSVINWQTYMRFNGADAQLDNGRTDSNVGNLWYNGGRIYNYAGNFSVRDIGLASSSFGIGHDGAGNQTLSMSGGLDVYQTGRTQGSGAWALPTIPRYANINSWGLNTVTDTSINVTVFTDKTCDAIDYDINGSGWIRGYNGGFTGASFTIGGLQPGTTYSIKVRVHAADSGLWTDSGLQSTTTQAFVVSTLTVPSTTDTTADLRAVVNYTADLLQYRIQGSSTWIDVAGDFTTKQITASGLTANLDYTFEVRARHKASGAYSAIKTVVAHTGFPQPLQPTNLAPAGGKGIGTLTPTLTWQYNATSPDVPTAYQILIKKQSDGTTVYDSGKTLSGLSTKTVPGSTLAWNTNYLWQVRTWSGTDIAGAYSTQVLFKTSQAPVVTVTAPTAQQTVTTDAPIISWTYADPEGTPETAYSITVERITAYGQTSGEVIYQTSVANSNATTYLLPAGTLQNGNKYLITVAATDSDGVVGTSTKREFQVVYVSPPAPNISTELSENLLFNRINVSTNKPADDAFDTDYLRIYRRKYGETAWNYLDQVRVNTNYVDAMDDNTGWSTSGVASALQTNTILRQGTGSLAFPTSAAGTAQWSKAATIGSLVDYNKIRVWVFTTDKTKITSVTFKLGTDASNYFSFQVAGSALANGVWKSIEVDKNALSITGSPTLANIGFKAIQVVGTAAIANGVLLIDSWNLAQTGNQLFVYDYLLANKASYEYSATAFNTSQNLESGRTVASALTVIDYADLTNIYLIPKGSENQAVIAFQDGKALPNWKTNTETQYYNPVGAIKPTVYVMGNQQYRTGSFEVIFWDSQFGGNGITGAKALELIANYKPLTIRTWWGDILNISIDGELNVERIKGLGYRVSFSWTEIA